MKSFYRKLGVISVLCAILIWAIWPGFSVSSAFAGSIYVPTDYPTIQAAIDAAQPGDQVLVASGTYYEHVTMKGYVDLLGGYESTGWTRDIENNPTIIDGGGSGDIVTMDTNTEGEGHATFDGFIVRNGACGFMIPGTPSVWELVISDNEFIGAGIHIEILGSTTIKNNVIHDVTSDGWGAYGALSFRQPRDLSIINNVIYNNYKGCYTWHEVGTVKYINNTIVNSGAAIRMQTDGDGPHIISNNIIIDNDVGIENTYNVAEYMITYNNVWNNGTNYVDCTPDIGNISDDPLFYGSESQDYNLRADSPCIDTGTNDASELPETDANNNSRIFDGDGDEVAVVDMGAFEFQGIPPTADAGSDQTVGEGKQVTLDGSNSTDSDGSIACYQWAQTGGTTVSLSDVTSSQPTFSAPDVGPDGGTLTFELTVTDNVGLQATDSCIVNVTWVNIPPSANAGSDQTVNEGVAVTLDGSNSTDPDDGIASYQWAQTAGTSVTLSDPTSSQPTFTSPDVGPSGEALTFELTITDNGGLQATDSCIVNVNYVDTTPPSGNYDTTPPSGSIAINNSATYCTSRDVTITLNSSDADYMCFSNDNTSFSSWEDYAASKSWTLSEGDGTKYVYVKYKDKTGNTAIVFNSIILDTIAPDSPVLIDIGDTIENEPTFDWKNVTDAGYYILQYADNPDFSSPITIESIAPSDYTATSALDDGTWYWRVYAVDAAGNVSGWSSTGIFTIDTTDYCESDPEKPVLVSPADGATDVSRTPTLTTSTFVDPEDCSTHWKTRWQISEHEDFHGLTLNANTFDNLTTFEITKTMLKPETTYYWRVKYWGTYGNKSEWSDVFSFTTEAAIDDTDDNGIPDDQEMDDSLDLDGDGISDNNQDDEIKSMKTIKGNANIGIRPQDSQITRAEVLDDDTVSSRGNKPKEVPYGLISFRLEVPNYGDTATVKIYLSKAAHKDARWMKYDEVDGWQDYSGHAVFNDSRDEVTVELKDGSYGDNDHTENGVIIDPSGIGIFDLTPCEDPPSTINVSMCDTDCQATVSVTASGVNLPTYCAPVNILVGVMSENCSQVWWLNSNCEYTTDYSQAAADATTLVCSPTLPDGTDNGWLFWLVTPDPIADLDWENGPYDLLFYQM